MRLHSHESMKSAGEGQCITDSGMSRTGFWDASKLRVISVKFEFVLNLHKLKNQNEFGRTGTGTWTGDSHWNL